MDQLKMKIWVPASGLLLIFVLLCLCCARNMGQTVDETFFLGSGYPIVRHNNYQVLGVHPPLMAQLGALPLLMIQPSYPEAIHIPETGGFDISKMGAKFLYDMGNNPELILFLTRIPIILISVLLGIVLYLWAYELFGFPAAILSLSLFVFCPNMIGNGSLYTTDLGVTAFIFLGMYRFKKLLEHPSIKNSIWVGVSVGLAFLSKVSALTLPLIFLAIIFMSYWSKDKISIFAPSKNFKADKNFDLFIFFLAITFFLFTLSEKTVAVILGPVCILALNLLSFNSKKWKLSWNKLRFVLATAGWIVCVAFLIGVAQKRGLTLTLIAGMWIGFIFGFTLWIKKRTEFTHMAKLFCLMWFIAASVVVLGYTDFLNSVRELSPFQHFTRMFHIALNVASSDFKICVAGSFVTCDWRYFLTTLLIKVPVATLFFLLCGVFCLIKSNVGTLNKVILFVSPLIFLAVASLLNHVNIGLRHVLPVFPFIFLIAGSSAHFVSNIRSRIIKRGLIFSMMAAVSWLVFINFKMLPNQLSYFNEFVGSTENGAYLSGGSNLNWGQDNARAIKFLKNLGASSVRVANTANNPDEFWHYGLAWKPATPEDFIRPIPGYFMMDVLYYAQEQQKKNSWFKNRKPDQRIGHTIYIFNVSNP